MPSSFDCAQDKRGFTLVELLVVISIIAILSVVGITIFTGVQKGARDAKRRADVDAITKAFEVKYNTTGSYGDLKPENNGNLFASGTFPKDPKGEDYTIIQDSQTKGFRICASLQDNPACSTPSDSCFCKSSQQAEPPSATGGTTTTSVTNPDAVGPTSTPTTIADDNQLSSFWNQGDENANYGSGTAKWRIDLSDDPLQKQSGSNSLKMAVSPGTYNVISVWKDDYNPRANWSSYKWVSFYWYGANTNTLMRFIIQTDVNGQQPWFNQLSCSFNDNFTGWRQMRFFLDNCIKTGNPDLGKVWRLFITTQASDIPSSTPSSFNWWVDLLQLSP